MALFQKKMSLPDLVKALRELSEDDLSKVMEQLDIGDDNDEEGKKDTAEEIEEAKEDIAEKGEDSQTEQDRIDESVAAQEEDSGEEDSQSAKDRVDESEGEEAHEEEEKESEADDAEESEEAGNAMDARLQAMEERLEKMAQTVERLADALENKPFGHRPSAPRGEGAENPQSEDDRIMSSYYGSNYRKY